MISKMIDNTLHSNIIKKVLYDQTNEVLLVLEVGAKKIKFYYPEPPTREYVTLFNLKLTKLTKLKILMHEKDESALKKYKFESNEIQ